MVTVTQHQDFMEKTTTSDKANYIFDMLLSGTSHKYESFVDLCREDHPDMYEKLVIHEYDACTTEDQPDDIPHEGTYSKLTEPDIIYDVFCNND